MRVRAWEEAAVAEEIEDLEAEATGLEERRYEAADRKYHLARGYAGREMKVAYEAKLSRRRLRKK